MARNVVAASTQYVKVPNAADFNISGGALTVGMLIKTTLSSGDTCPLGKWDPGSNRRQFLLQMLNPGPKLRVALSSNGTLTYVQDGTTNLTPGWWHIALVYDSPNLFCYVNGASEGSVNIGISIGAQTSDLFFGCISSLDVPAVPFDGDIAEVGIWNAALTASEMASLGKRFSPRLIRPQSLKGYWPLTGKYSPEIDLARGNNGTVTGATASEHPRVYYPGIIQSFSQEAAPEAEQPRHRLTEIFPEILIRQAPAVTSARLTEIIPEILVRDPLEAAPARLTGIIPEIVLHSPLTALADGSRFTQQSVEILYLEPAADPTFDDCLQYQGPREWEARIYDDKDPDTGKRKAYGEDGEDLASVIQELNFEIQERGGYGGGSLSFNAPWDKVSFSGNERVDVRLWGSPAYRGYLRINQKDLNSPESARPQFYGMVALLDQWAVKRKYAYGCDTDVTQIFRDIAEDYVAVSGRFPSVSIDTSAAVGFTLKEFDARGSSVAQAFNELADSIPGGIVWGVEMDAGEPIPGDVLYMRPKPTETAYVVPVGDNVEAFVYPVDTHEIVNSLAPLKGGTVAQENLCPNGSFEEVAPASEEHGNYLLNSSFEDDDGSHPYWTSIGPDPTVKFAGHPTAHGSARTGNQWAELDETGEGFYQEVQIIPGRRYEAACWARLEDPEELNSGLLTLEAYTSGGALLATDSEALDNLTGTYQRFVAELDLASYPTAEVLRITVESNGGSAANNGVIVDDCGIYEYCAKAQENWRVIVRGNATLTELDWAYEGVAARTGEYVVHVKVEDIALSSDTVDLYMPQSLSPSVDPNERYTLIVWWHVSGSGTAADDGISIGVVNVKSDLEDGDTEESDTIVGNPSAFTYALTNSAMAYLDFVTDSDTARLQPFIRIRTNRHIYIDDVMLVKGEIPDEVRDSGGYWPADMYERYIDVTHSGLTASLDTDVDDSIDDYDEHEKSVTNELVTDYATALAFAAGYFNANALPKVEASLTIYGARELIAQEGKVRIVNLPSAPPALWPSRSSYSITESAINCQVELGNVRPDLQRLLQLTAERARR